jgi:hypothetical protein
MSDNGWVVEEIVTPGPDLDVRTLYIGLLQQMIDTLKETTTVDMGEGNPVEIIPLYSVPTVVFAFLDTESVVEGDEDGEQGKALAQLICYIDRRDFLKDLTSYGDEDFIKEYGLTRFVEKDEPTKTT